MTLGRPEVRPQFMQPRMGYALLAEFQVCDDLTIAVNVFLLEVIEQAATFSNKLEQPTTGVVVLFVGLEVLGEVGDALGNESDLNLRGARIRFMSTERGNNPVLEFLRECHFCRSYGDATSGALRNSARSPTMGQLQGAAVYARMGAGQ